MKLNQFVICTLVVICLTSVILITVGGRSNRQSELDSTLDAVVEETLSNVKADHTYEIANYQEFLADFMQALSVNLDCDSDIIINVLKADMEKGLLSIEVIEKYTHPNGKSGTVKCDKTVIFNQLLSEDTDTYTIHYYLSEDDMTAGENCYKTYDITSGDLIPAPIEPESTTGEFVCWVDEDGNEWNDSIQVTIDKNFYATWK